MSWTLASTDREWLEEQNLAVHSGYKSKQEAEVAINKVWPECEPYIEDFMVVVSSNGSYYHEKRYCILVANPDWIPY